MDQRERGGARWRRWLVGLGLALVALLAPRESWAQPGAIQGQVWAEGHTAYVVGAAVEAYDASGVLEGSAVVAQNGFYTISGLAPGNHYVRTRVTGSMNYVDVAFGDVPCVPCTMPAGTSINVLPGTIMASNDLTLPVGGAISGFVLPAGLMGGIGGVTVRVFSGTQMVKSDVSLADGSYAVVGLPPGTYFARTFVPSSSPYIDEAWDNIPCTPCVMGSTTPIALDPQEFRDDIDFVLERGGQISGRVSSVLNQVGLQNVIVTAVTASGYSANAVTVTGGTYTINGLPSGTYYVSTNASGNYIDEVWDNIPCAPCTPQAVGTGIAITGSLAVSNINFGLLSGGAIAGTITASRTASAIEGALVTVYTATGTAGIALSDATGAYQVTGLAAGSYYVRVRGPLDASYIPEAYNNVPCAPCPGLASLSTVSVAAGATTGNISFALDVGGQIAGSVRNSITSVAIDGITVDIMTAAGAVAASADSTANGTYVVRGLPSGTYYARTAGNSAWQGELFNNLPCPRGACTVTAGAAIVVSGTQTVTNITFSLRPLGPADAVLDFGALFGLYKLSPTGQWQNLSPATSEDLVTGDLDGNGQDDLVVDFGNARGVWAWMNHSTWQFLVPFSPTAMVMGDVNGNGVDDLLLSFIGYGLWRYGDGTWTQVHPLQPSHLAIANLDGNAARELVADFAGYGTYILSNNVTWTQIHGLTVSKMVAADLNGDGSDELLLDFPGAGVWTYRNGTWAPLHPFNVTQMTVGYIDDNSRADVVIDFGGLGVWLFANDTSWTQLHGLASQGLLLLDRDGSGRDELLIDFGAQGLWQYDPDPAGGWLKLHPFSPTGMAGGRLH